MSFAELKRSSKTSLNKLTEELEKIQNPKNNFGPDERFWKPTVDKAGNGFAIIRFLPAPEGDDFPFVRYWDHGFQVKETGGWYIELSRTTLGKNEKDPVSEANSKLWNTGLESNKQIARDRKRRLHYVSNIYVVKDSAHPENEGKVFLYEYGKRIFGKINDMANPPFEGDKPVNIFDFWKGATFNLRIRKLDGQRNYDSSTFETSGALLEDDDALEAIYKSEYSLGEFVSPARFKTYEELLERFNRVTGATPSGTRPSLQAEEAKPIPSEESPEVQEPESNSEDDEELGFFKRLAVED